MKADSAIAYVLGNGRNGHESFIRSILEKGKRYIFGSEEDFLIACIEGPKREWYEEIVCELIDLREAACKFPESSLGRLQILSEYVATLSYMAKHFSLLDPLVIEFIDGVVKYIETKNLEIDGRKRTKKFLKKFFLKIIPDLTKRREQELSPEIICREYDQELKKIKDREIPKARTQNERKRRESLTARAKALQKIYPSASEKEVEKWKMLEPYKIARMVLAKKYHKSQANIRDLVTEGERRIRRSKELMDFLRKHVFPIIS